MATGHTTATDESVEASLRSQFGAGGDFEDVEFGAPNPPPPPPPPASPLQRPHRQGLLDKMRSTITPGKGTGALSAAQSESLLGASRAAPSHTKLPAARAGSGLPGLASPAESFSVTQSPGLIDYEVSPRLPADAKLARPGAGGRSVFHLAAAPAVPAPPTQQLQHVQGQGGGAAPELPLSDGPDGELGPPLSGQRRRFQALSERLQGLMQERVFGLLVVAIVAVVVAAFFVVLFFSTHRGGGGGGCLTTVVGAEATAAGTKIVVRGLTNPAVTVCPGDDDDSGPWVSEDSFQALLAAQGELYSEARASFTFGVPGSAAQRWSVQLQLSALKLEANGTAELQVDEWYAPPRTTYPGSDDFLAVYGSDAVLTSPLLVFAPDADEGAALMSGSDEDRR